MGLLVNLANSSVRKFELQESASPRKLKMGERMQLWVHKVLMRFSSEYAQLVHTQCTLVGKQINFLRVYAGESSLLVQKKQLDAVFDLFGQEKDGEVFQQYPEDSKRAVEAQFDLIKERFNYIKEMTKLDLNRIFADSSSDNYKRLDLLDTLIQAQLEHILNIKIMYGPKMGFLQKDQLSLLYAEHLKLRQKLLESTERPKTLYNRALRTRHKINLNKIPPPVYLNNRLGEGDNQKGSTGALVKIADSKGHHFALKHVWPTVVDFGEGDQQLVYPGEEGFKKERSLLKSLHHKGVVSYIDGGKTSKDLGWKEDQLPIGEYVVLEFADRGDLSTIFGQSQPADFKRNLGYLLQIGRALRYLHKKGIVHRDLKPDNILLFNDGSEHGAAKLTDFDAACRLKDKKAACEQSGSPDRMAPEILNKNFNAAALKKADIWMFGLLVAEGLNPKAVEEFKSVYPQLKRQEEVEAAVKVLVQDLQRSLLTIHPDADKIIDLVSRLLSYQPEKRPEWKEILVTMGTVFTSQL